MTAARAPEPGQEDPRPERALGAALAVGLLAAAAAMVLFGWLGDEVLESGVPSLDQRLRVALHAVASPELTAVMRAASLYGSPAWLAPLGLALALGFALRGWWRGGVLVLVTLAGAALLDDLLKHLFARPRPTAYFGYPEPTSFSFPSGHALFSICFFGGLAVLLAPRLRHPALRLLVVLSAAVAVALIGLSRIYLGVHYPSDVLGGYAAGVVWVAAVAAGDRLADRRHRRPVQ
jgi:membrane-associated phospholipid phosphatase